MDFIGTGLVILKEGTVGEPMAFAFAACSTALANDGSLPFGTTITSAEIIVKDSAGADITNNVASDTAVSGGLTVTTRLTCPDEAVKGRCKVYVLLTLSDGAVLTKRWDGLRV